VVVGPRTALGRDIVHLNELNWLGAELPADGMRVAARLRSAMAPVPARLIPGAAGTARLALDQPHPGIAPGQAGVIYDGSRVLGGGWIASAELSMPGGDAKTRASAAAATSLAAE